MLWASCFLRQAPTTIEANATAAEHAATRAIGASAKAENLKALAELSATADHQADHIRGIVAATMAQIVAEATRDSAAQWQKWALDLSDTLPVSP